jgi:hypothetical protein
MYTLRHVQAVFFVALISIAAAAQTVRPVMSPTGPQGIIRLPCDIDCGPLPTPTPTPTPAPPPPPPDLTFDATAYENIYPDIKNVYGNNLAGATSHYQLLGLPAGRRGGVIFDPVFYLQHNSDLLAAFGPTGYQAAAQHFISTGLPKEGRQGSQEFDVRYYLANNSDLLAAFGATGYIAAAQHFLNQGWPVEGRQGSATVAIKTYINNYPEVQTYYGLFSDQYKQSMFHWLRRGKGFGRIANAALPVVSSDCTAATPPNVPGTSTPAPRVYIGLLGFDGTGATPDSPRDGRNFDAILRPYSGDPAGGIPATDGLIVCILPGVYLTDGAYNYVVAIPHNSEKTQNRGFALGPHWHVHGYGSTQTTVQLNSYYLPPSGGEPASPWVLTGSNVVFSTGADFNPGVEISDMTIDDNYPALKAQAGAMPLRLEAIHLRDNIGGHHVHHLNVVNAASEDPLGEAFPIWIVSVAYTISPSTPAAPLTPPSQDNTVEFVIMSQWHGHLCTAITMAFATGTVQFNVVRNYQIGFGGWEMPLVPANGSVPAKFDYFHDNFTVNTQYGFNIDSDYNDAVNIQFNEIINPSSWGFVVGSSTSDHRFDSFQFLYNEILFESSSTLGLLFQGMVTNAVVTRTNFLVGIPGGASMTLANPGNFANIFEFNQIDSGLRIGPDIEFPIAGSCVYGNWDQNGTQRSDFPNTVPTPCRPGL